MFTDLQDKHLLASLSLAHNRPPYRVLTGCCGRRYLPKLSCRQRFQQPDLVLQPLFYNEIRIPQQEIRIPQQEIRIRSIEN